MQILKTLENHIEHLLLIIVIAILSMIAYASTSDEPPPRRKKSMVAGGVIAMILSYPTWMAIGKYLGGGEIDAFWLIPITFTYTVTGQFIPEFLQNVIPKTAKKVFSIFFKRTTGEDLNDDH